MEELLNSIIVANTEQKVFLLPQLLQYKELGINFLIECLRDPQLEVRSTAYELLQNIESEAAQKAIKPGLLLNPGDKVYNVYQSGMGFTDTVYLLFDYIDDAEYLEELRIQVCGTENFDDESLMCGSKRVFCYGNREKAEQVAEDLHKKMIMKTGIGIGGFEWRKENPNFNAEEWCINNNIQYKNEWKKLDDFQVIWKIKEIIYQTKNKSLEDKLRRSRYIYHPKCIDTWCKDQSN